jgi:hypothetical protein
MVARATARGRINVPEKDRQHVIWAAGARKRLSWIAAAAIALSSRGFTPVCSQEARNLMVANTGSSQQDIDLRWNNMLNGCLRAFFFEGNCNDEMGVENGVPTGVSYLTSRAGYGQQIKSNGDTTVVNCGSAADIDNLTTFSVAFLWESFTAGEGLYGQILDKDKLII